MQNHAASKTYGTVSAEQQTAMSGQILMLARADEVIE
jgi:hypothetical protein